MKSYTNTQKPESVLKRVNDIITTAIGNNADKEKRIGLEMLHNYIKRKGNWTKGHEVLMKRHIELCVDLKDHRTSKDGLHSYRNLCQHIDPNSLEQVISHLIELAESRATSARDRADQVALAAAAKISDLDQEESPESIMLSSMTEEGSRDRTDREVVVPWLKFLWETYRAVLELLHKNARLDKLYRETCEKAFHFCSEYKRHLEFRRLCEMLRTQLSSLQKLTTPQIAAPTSALFKKSLFEWTPEAIELHLKIRFHQLDVAISLELWNEGFRTVEDIYSIMSSTKKSPKPQILSGYYEKLTTIFWVSENLLFHAYAWSKFHYLSCEHRKDMTPEQRSLQASNVILSALIIPSLKDAQETSALAHFLSGSAGDEDELVNEKNQQMAMLLDFQANPTRSALLNDILAKGVLNSVLPEVAQLFHALESKFHPLQLINSLQQSLNSIRANPALQKYILPLQKIVALRTVQQLSRVFQTIKISFLRKLMAPLSDLTYFAIEKLLIDSVARKQLNLTIDHATATIRFGNKEIVTSHLETELSKLGSELNKVEITLKHALSPAEESKSSQFAADCLEATRREHVISKEMKEQISRKKGELKERKERRQAELDSTKKIIESQRVAEDSARIAVVNQEREAKRLDDKKKQEECEITLNRLKSLSDQLGPDAAYKGDINTILKLSEQERTALVNKFQQEVVRNKDESERRVFDQAKKLDYITRALRIETGRTVVQRYNEQTAVEQAAYSQKQDLLLQEHREKHASSLLAKQRMMVFAKHRASFEDSLLAEQKAFHAQQVVLAQTAALRKHWEDKVNAARSQLAKKQERERLEIAARAAKQAKEEEERLILERDQRIRQERLEKEMAEKEEADREQDERKEKERLERVRKAEAEDRAKREAQEKDESEKDSGEWKRVVPRGTPLPSGSGPSSDAPRPYKAPSGGGGGWRDGGAFNKSGGGGGGGDRGGGDRGGWGGSGGGRDREERGTGGGRDKEEKGTGGGTSGGWRTGGSSKPSPPPPPSSGNNRWK